MSTMTWLDEVMQQWPPIGAQRPYLRLAVDEETWRQAASRLADTQGTMLALWAEPDAVHLAVESEGRIGVLTLACPDRRFPSIGRLHPPAQRRLFCR